MAPSRAVTIVEVGPRDGLQPIGPFVPTTRKSALIHELVAAGLQRIEIGSFASPGAVPQMRDTPELLAECNAFPGLDAQVLVPTERWGRMAAAAGARHIVFVLSISPAHNRSNVRREPADSAGEYAALLSDLPPETKVRLNVATAFDCPFDGRVDMEATLGWLDRLIPLRPDVEVCLCDTTGRVAPDHVSALFAAAQARFDPATRWAFHAHDTYGLGTANTLVAYQQGVRVFDASIAGLGGCPFAPGATGNVATEDLVWMFERMGIATGIDAAGLVAVARDAATLPGAAAGGRVRAALSAQECRETVVAA